MRAPRFINSYKPLASIRACCVIASILLFIVLSDALTRKNSLPKDYRSFTVEQKTQMEFLLGNDTTHLILPKGETVSFLGYRRASYYFPHKFLVETTEGQRGWINVCDLNVPFVKEKSGDTVHIKKIDAKKNKYVYLGKDSKEAECGFEKVYPVLSDTLPYLVINKEGEYYMSPKKFERLYLGKPLSDVDNHYIPATQIYHDKQGARVSMKNYWIFDKKSGKFHHPVLIYNDSLIATDYILHTKHGNNGLLLRILPFVGNILDVHLFSSLVRGSFYEARIPGMTLSKADTPNWVMYVMAALTLLFSLIWWFCALALPVVLIGYLIRFHFLFYHLDDGILIGLIATIAVVSCYIWTVLIVSWGMLWFFVPVLVILAIYFYRVAVTPLGNVPHDRCLGCRRIGTIYLEHSDLVREYDQWETRSFHERSFKSGERRWQTYTETRYSDGHTETSNHRDHKEETTTHVYGTYHCLVHYREYEHFYKCSACGNVEMVPEKQEDILEKQKTGEHSSTTTRQVY